MLSTECSTSNSRDHSLSIYSKYRHRSQHKIAPEVSTIRNKDVQLDSIVCVCHERDKSVQFIVLPLKSLRSKLFQFFSVVRYRLHKSQKHLQNCHSTCRAKNLTNAVKHINKQRFQKKPNRIEDEVRERETEKRKKISRVIAATKFICFIKCVTTFTNINVLKIKSTFSCFMFIGCVWVCMVGELSFLVYCELYIYSIYEMTLQKK